MPNWKQKLPCPGDKGEIPWVGRLDYQPASQEKEPFVESLALRGNAIGNSTYHQMRFDRTRKAFHDYLALSDSLPPIDLQQEIFRAYEPWLNSLPLDIRKRIENSQIAPLIKVRVVYGLHISAIEFQIYTRPSYRWAIPIRVRDLKYRFKWNRRDMFDRFCSNLGPREYPIFILDGFLTDGLTANIVVSANGKLITPHRPLLEGTMRQALLEKGLIQPAPIHEDSLFHGQAIMFINALNPLNTWTLQYQRNI